VDEPLLEISVPIIYPCRLFGGAVIAEVAPKRMLIKQKLCMIWCISHADSWSSLPSCWRMTTKAGINLYWRVKSTADFHVADSLLCLTSVSGNYTIHTLITEDWGLIPSDCKKQGYKPRQVCYFWDCIRWQRVLPISCLDISAACEFVAQHCNKTSSYCYVFTWLTSLCALTCWLCFNICKRI